PSLETQRHVHHSKGRDSQPHMSPLVTFALVLVDNRKVPFLARLPSYSTFTASARPNSCRICRSSATKLFAESPGTVTENSSPIFSSEPERSFGRIFVPRRFQTSGGTVPTRRSIRVEAVAPG